MPRKCTLTAELYGPNEHGETVVDIEIKAPSRGDAKEGLRRFEIFPSVLDMNKLMSKDFDLRDVQGSVDFRTLKEVRYV
ncbi:MAG TPA: hypothetical protein VGO43_08235 [Pyrinomonadaceae bacterium]|jgi:hypothetical protein|nr:hypothetical protein [Pyrinomonadaceae bacterium]